MAVQAAEPSWSLRLESAGACRTGGQGLAVAVSGFHAFLADGTNGLRIIDVSDVDHPVEAACFNDGKLVWDVCLKGQYALIAQPQAGITVLDVSNPASPVFVTNLILSSARQMMLQDSRLFVARDTYGLEIVDVSNPAMPVSIGHYTTTNRCYSVVVKGNTACYARYGRGYFFLDVSDPSLPVEIASVDASNFSSVPPASLGNSFVVVNYQYVNLLSVTNPAQPSVVGSYSFPAQLTQKKVVGRSNQLFIALGSGGLRVVDFSNPAAPQPAGFFDTEGQANDLAVTDEHVFVADGSLGLRIVRYSMVPNPVQLGNFTLPGDFRLLHKAGDVGWFKSRYELRAFDLSNPTNAVPLGIVLQNSSIQNVQFKGDYVFVTIWGGGLFAFDVSQPSQPVQVASIPSSALYTGLVLAGKFGVASGYNNNTSRNLELFDLGIPQQPVFIGYYTNLADRVTGVSLLDNYLSVEFQSNGNEVFRLDRMNAVRSLGRSYVPARSDFSGNIAFYAGFSSGVVAHDLNHFDQAESLGYWKGEARTQPYQAAMVNCVGPWIMAGGSEPSFDILDGRDPAHLVRVAGWQRGYNSAYLGSWVYVDGDRIYLPKSSNVIEVLTWPFGLTNAPSVSYSPRARLGRVGQDSIFSVRANGKSPLTYQWLREGVPLEDGGKVSGTDTPNLVVTGLSLSDMGNYSVVVSNAFGVTTSQVARLDFDLQLSPAEPGLSQFPGQAWQFPSEAGFLYTLMAKTNIQQPGWSVICSQTSTGGVMTLSDPEVSFGSKFYRVGVTNWGELP